MNKAIKRLVNFGLAHQLLKEEDVIYVTNQLLDILQLHDYEDVDVESEQLTTPQPILDDMLAYAIEKGIIEDTIVSKDLFDTRIMNALMPRPSEVIAKFIKRVQRKPQIIIMTYLVPAIICVRIVSQKIFTGSRKPNMALLILQSI